MISFSIELRDCEGGHVNNRLVVGENKWVLENKKGFLQELKALMGGRLLFRFLFLCFQIIRREIRINKLRCLNGGSRKREK